MNKHYLIFAAVATIGLTSCSSKDDLEILPSGRQQTSQSEPGTVTFDVYTQRASASTRGGWAGSLTTAELKKSGNGDSKGFGVFGYYTDNNDYDQRDTPNFFYNQQVTYQTDKWAYEPVKYWPNEYGGNAISDDNDKVTFFAYAPYVEVVPTSGKLVKTDDGEEKWGITGLSKNSAQGDPIVKYIASFNPQYSVDLCWGVVGEGSTKWGKIQTPSDDQKLTAGFPWYNIERPAQNDQKVMFTFKHATAQMEINIDAEADIYDHAESDQIAKKTRVWVREVKFKGFAVKGALNLNNDETANEPKWVDYAGQYDLETEEVIVYDGRKDGKEGMAGSVATDEKTLGLNPSLVQDGVYAAKTDGDDIYDKDKDIKILGGSDGTTDRTGVTVKNQKLFETDGTLTKFHVIPNSDNFEIEIVYDIETIDKNLAQNLSDGATKGSTVENRISKAIKFGSDDKLHAGHSYVVNLHLGMNSVDFDAAVTDWVDEAPANVDLPANFPVFLWANNGDFTATIPYVGDYNFAFTGMNGGTSIAQKATSNIESKVGGEESETASAYLTDWTSTNDNARADGVALQTVTTAANPNTVDRTQKIKYTDNTDGTSATLTITQQAHPLFMKITEATKETNTITLTRYDDAGQSTSADWKNQYGWICDGTGKAITAITTDNYIKVWRNGTELEWKTDAITNSTTPKNVFNFKNDGEVDNTTVKITIGDNLMAGDVIKVTIKTGDAPEETVTYTVAE